ncbi:RNA polymerase sigma factor SigJ [Nocardia bhagyanarayanae]|uniref:RNA polymerase sigma-70 factor (ECF subfamily) n=1 Tax=Nocardia bhagyanarayanae TaxID=1215925 RepID=A0A543FBY5_9NOCA|nr:RNA polymerase sigma factor SigJ [Nocardia bhagyanarayanae]TQM31347.1 RNA polymerase sigma-70 factor (ECF subfamily) [Nocardia bhagyanarayanae]
MIETMEEQATEVFAEHRELLFSIVYSMLGTVTDTEDVLQDTWLAWVSRHRSELDEITSPRAYLVRIAVNNALSRRETLARRRETYVGPWLPEPLVADTPEVRDSADAAEIALRGESVSLAMLVVLETLTPLERAVFVLHEVFGYPHAEIGAMLGRATPAIRQLAHRARDHVRAKRPRYQADARTQRAVTERFLAAQLSGDVTGLLELLAPDVTFLSDGGGLLRAALRPVHGPDKVARLLTSRMVLSSVPDMTIRYGWTNGEPSAVVCSGGAPAAVLLLDVDADTGKVRTVYAIRNPEKLTHLRG